MTAARPPRPRPAGLPRSLTVDADAYAALRAIAVAGDLWDHQPDAAGTYTVDVAEDVHDAVTAIAASTGWTPSAVILARIRVGLN